MKANQRARSGARSHAVSGEYKIPIEDREAYQGSNTAKFVSKKEYDKYVKWKKDGKPKRN